MKTLEDQLLAAGLHTFGCCERLSAYPDLLQLAPLLQDFTAAEADILGASMRLIRAAPGQVIIQEGESGDWMLLILKGTVDITKRIEALLPDDLNDETSSWRSSWAMTRAPDNVNSADGADDPNPDATNMPPHDSARKRDNAGFVVSRVAVIKRGTSLGEMSMLDSEPRYASCTALDEVEAAVLGRHEIALLIRDHPGVGAKLLVKITQLMAQRLRNTSNHLVKLLRKR